MTVMEQSRLIKRQKQSGELKIKAARSRSPSMEPKSAAPMPYNPLVELLSALPSWYKKIHARFPRLSYEQCTELMEIIRSAPGNTIAVHSGQFTAIERPTGGTQRRADVSWSCCHAISDKGIITHCEADAYFRNGILMASNFIGKPACKESPDRMKPIPCGKCDKPTTFSLEVDDFP